MKTGKYYSIYETKMGSITIGSDGDKITHVLFGDCSDHFLEKSEMHLLNQAAKQMEEYFEGSRVKFDIPYHAEGTVFQEKVWEALCQIPYGQTRSYKQIAEMIQHPKASRAVGMANNKNPIAIIIPCHRVIGADGSLSGYGGGTDKKTFLLKMEKGNAACLYQ